PNTAARATFTVNNRNPIAVNDAYSTPFNTTLTVPAADGVLLHGTADSDADGDSLKVTAHTNPGHGTLSIASDGSFTYTPTAGFTGPTDTFTYTVSDGQGGTATATVTITIGVNHPPVAFNDSNSVTEDVTLTATGNVLSNDSDPDPSTTLRASLVGSGTGTYGSVTIGSDGAYTYTLNNSAAIVQALAQGQSVTDIFSYAASDGNASTNATLTITINGTNDPPVAQDGTLTTAEDTPATGTLVATDIDSPTLTYSLVSTANAHGVVTITDVHTGAYSYTPDADYNGPASFTFKANDGALDSNLAAVSTTVTPVNNPPARDEET